MIEEHREEIKTKIEMFEPAGFKKEDASRKIFKRKIEVLEHKEMFKHKEDSEMIEKKTEVLEYKEDPEVIGKKDDNKGINNQEKPNRTP